VGIKISLVLSLLVLVFAVAGCGGTAAPSANSAPEIAFQSPVLTASKVIPARYRCNANKIWLPVQWGALPAKTKELVIYVARYSDIKTNPNGATARLLSQALIVGLKPTMHELRAGKLPHGALVGEYVTGNEHVPICPPGRPAQGFVFRLYALPERLNISKGNHSGSLLTKLNGEALAAGTFTASYART
jgi:phosphatidylethanolamine-binding protein (PEBP) family uncharacterized protein